MIVTTLLLIGATLGSAFKHDSPLSSLHQKRSPSHLQTRHRKSHSSSGSGSSSSSSSSSSSPWTLSSDLSGENFVNSFDFVSGQSDNGGMANYLSQEDASNAGIYYLTKNNSIYLGTETTENVGNLRKAIKVTSKEQYQDFMMIVDLEHLPATCGAWPAIWSTGDNWPYGGEMDLIEYVNTQSLNSYSIHTGGGCSMSSSGSGFSAKYMMTDASQASDCNTAATDAQGCGTRSVKSNSAGVGANSNGGGIYAMIQNSAGVTMYGFNRTSAPDDIYSDSPNPSNWGEPDFFAAADTCPTSSFSGQTIVININLAGTWPSGVWDADNSYANQAQSCQQSTGTSMNDFILNQGWAFSEAYFLINSIKIFK